MSDKELRVSKIKDGTVIDHISGGYALDVVKILGITRTRKEGYDHCHQRSEQALEGEGHRED